MVINSSAVDSTSLLSGANLISLGSLHMYLAGQQLMDDRGGRDRCEPTLGRDLVTVPLMQRLGRDVTR